MERSKHHPAGGARLHWDNSRVETLIAQYQTRGDLESLAEIVDLTQRRALTLIRFRKTTQYKSEAELLSDVNFKLLKAVKHFNPAKGSAFTFVSQVVINELCTSVSNARKSAERYRELSRTELRRLPAKAEDHSAAEDLLHRIKTGLRTSLSDPTELAAQRWFVKSFTTDGFESRRHQCANAAIAVYNLSHAKSRELYDVTMLGVRRLLYGERNGPRSTIIPGRLAGTRCAWMSRYAVLMNPAEFTKFVVLMRDLAPYLLLIIDPEHDRASHRRDRSPAIGRRHIELILNGDPDAVLLFGESISVDDSALTADDAPL